MKLVFLAVCVSLTVLLSAGHGDDVTEAKLDKFVKYYWATKEKNREGTEPVEAEHGKRTKKEAQRPAGEEEYSYEKFVEEYLAELEKNPVEKRPVKAEHGKSTEKEAQKTADCMCAPYWLCDNNTTYLTEEEVLIQKGPHAKLDCDHDVDICCKVDDILDYHPPDPHSGHSVIEAIKSGNHRYICNCEDTDISIKVIQ